MRGERKRKEEQIKCKCWRVKCKCWSVKCKCWSVKCKCWSVKCKCRSVRCKCWSVKCKCRSVKCKYCRVVEHRWRGGQGCKPETDIHLHVFDWSQPSIIEQWD